MLKTLTNDDDLVFDNVTKKMSFRVAGSKDSDVIVSHDAWEIMMWASGSVAIWLPGEHE